MSAQTDNLEHLLGNKLDNELSGLGAGEAKETSLTRCIRLGELIGIPAKAIHNDLIAGDTANIGHRVGMWLKHG